ncbi:MAG: D-alanyl-D-alanine carboxypeptidase family protein [Novosphingobium sp.]
MKFAHLALLLGLSASAAGGADYAPPPPAQAPIALLVDLSAGRTLFARDADRRILPASMTKAMSALVAFDLIAAGRLHEDAIITVRPETAARWAGKGTTLNLRPGEQVSVRELLQGLNTVSANDAAVALAEGALGSTDAWVAAMNDRARQLGMTGSHFANPNGFPDRGATYVTARDMVVLAEALIVQHPELYRRYIGKQAMEWRGARLVSHDPFAGVLPGADGIKTGHTFEAGFNFLGAARRDGRRLVLVIGRSPTEPGRAAAARNLAEWGYWAWDSRPFLTPQSIVGAARVQDGDAREVPLTVARPYAFVFPRGQDPQPTGRIVYIGPIRAPITKGQPVARLEIAQPGQEPYSVPLVAARAVDKAGPIDRLTNGLLGLFQ